MTNSLLEPGLGEAPAPSATPANPLVPQPRPQAPGISPMMQHFGGEMHAASALFDKVSEAARQVTATRKELDHLVALQDTVTQDDVVKAASGMVAAGIPAVQVASMLAEMPDGSEALQAWLQQQDQAVQQREAQVGSAMQGARYRLGVSALKHVIGHSAESHEQKRLLAAAVPQGRA